MKRYNMDFYETDSGPQINIVESKSGEWVKYEDAEKEKSHAIAQAIVDINLKKNEYIPSFKESADAIINKLEEIRCGLIDIETNTDKAECNCIRMQKVAHKKYYSTDRHYRLSWVCKTHGFKRF